MHTPFTLRVNSEDGDQNITGVTVKTPPGFAATLKGVPYCPQSALDRLSNSSYSGLVRDRIAGLPSRESGRHRGRWSSAPAPIRSTQRQGLSGGSVQRGAAELWSWSCPRSRGRTTWAR